MILADTPVWIDHLTATRWDQKRRMEMPNSTNVILGFDPVGKTNGGNFGCCIFSEAVVSGVGIAG